MDCFQDSHVYIREKEKVEKIIDKIIKDGFPQLQIIADFDMTMSKSEQDGTSTKTTFGVLENCSKMSQAMRDQTNKNSAYYYPLEMDPSISSEEKIPLMIEWYNKNFDLIVKAKYHKDDLSEIVKDADSHLRDGCHEILKMLNEKGAPVLIISAGLGDIIQEILKQQSELFDNIKIIANFMEFDDEGYIIATSGELIHTFNKSNAPLRDPSYFEKVKKRKNVIMLGDSLGDHKMVDHLKDDYNILKIGFLNKKENLEASLVAYQDIYDAVIANDQTWDILSNLLKRL